MARIAKDNILMKTLYKLLVDDCKSGKVNWASNVKQLLDNYGFSYVWSNPYAVNLITFHSQFKMIVLDGFKQQWINDLENCTSLVLYKNYKLTFELESYLCFLPKKFRFVLTRFRLAAHSLRIVTGRFAPNREERHMRICNVCRCADVEDEYHFLLVCPAYGCIRKQYINSYYYRRPSVYKFIELLQCSNECVIKRLSKYIYEAFMLRNSHIQNNIVT